MIREAETLGLDYVFACTLDERAQQFFERQGFQRVEHDAVPASKWRGYDARRRQRLATFRLALPAHASATGRAS
jgi:amino-acid N-acetyltransferase